PPLPTFPFHPPPPPPISPLSLHDALPICHHQFIPRFSLAHSRRDFRGGRYARLRRDRGRDDQADSNESNELADLHHFACPKAWTDRKSTRLNSSHRTISYAVFCLKKKKKT